MQLGIFLGGVIKHLQFAHADVGGVALAGVTNGEAVVATRGQLDLHPHNEVAVVFVGVNGAAFAGLALDGAVGDLIIVNRARPTGEVFAVEDGFETLLFGHGAEAHGQQQGECGELFFHVNSIP